ncbi:6441_t:CDS:2 [Ambispora gerdemannii]|uniref:Elongin-C n=1 Tax=Ambispora gerdemannii TaxID=144530 RepID=A0A9N9FWW9_9GLOM|nr:6441_t:CDS:2 [Ambispora gerdemannii]
MSLPRTSSSKIKSLNTTSPTNEQSQEYKSYRPLPSSSIPVPIAFEEPPEYVKLISSDGFEFIIARQAALCSGTIKNMLSSPGQFQESEKNEINFRDIKAVILEKVCQYLYYKVKYTDSTNDIPNFDIDPQMGLELLMAADFLDC